MNRSTPGFPVHHQLLEFTQTQVHEVGDAIQSAHHLSSPSPPAFNPSQHQGPGSLYLSSTWLHGAGIWDQIDAPCGIHLLSAPCLLKLPLSSATAPPTPDSPHSARGGPHLTTLLQGGSTGVLFWGDSSGPRLPWKEEGEAA